MPRISDLLCLPLSLDFSSSWVSKQRSTLHARYLSDNWQFFPPTTQWMKSLFLPSPLEPGLPSLWPKTASLFFPQKALLALPLCHVSKVCHPLRPEAFSVLTLSQGALPAYFSASRSEASFSPSVPKSFKLLFPWVQAKVRKSRRVLKIMASTTEPKQFSQFYNRLSKEDSWREPFELTV